MKVTEQWFSDRLQQPISIARWGHFGVPVLVFPTAGGDADEVTRLARAFSVYVERRGVLLDHTLATALVDTDGRVVEIWRGSGWKVSEVVDALHHEVREPTQDPGPLLGRPVLPRGQDALGGLDRAARLGRSHPGHLGDRHARRGVDDREARARVGIDPGAVDIGLVAQKVGREGCHDPDDSD